MDFKGLLSVYNKPWLIEPEAAARLLDVWEKVQAGEPYDWKKIKGERADGGLTAFKINAKFFEQSIVKAAPDNTWDMEDFDGFDGAQVAVIPVSGPLMKADYCGSFGTNTLRQLTMMADKTASVKTICFLIDSPGGTVDGTEAFARAITGCGKDTVALIDGMQCSAAYWIGSACDKIYACNSTDVIGSIGVMCALVDKSEADKQKGVVVRTYYASQSKDKNKAFDDAMAGDGKALIKEILNPLADAFINAVKVNRGDRLKNTDDTLSGKVFYPTDATAYGLIDGMADFDQIVNEALSKNKMNFETTNKNTNMTTADLKNAHPGTYNEIVAIGVAQERDRVNAWMELVDMDAAAVKAGVATDKAPTASEVVKITKAGMQKATVEAIKNENAEPVQSPQTPATPTDANAQQIEALIKEGASLMPKLK